MIPLGITLLVFFVIGLLLKSKTYFILAIFSWINIYVDKFTTSHDLYLMLTYTSIDFLAALAILFFGDIHKIYQSVLLTLMVFAHCLMEMALVNDYSFFIESNIYTDTITLLLLAQMMGVFYGIDRIFNPVCSPNTDMWETCNTDLLDRKERN
jgi:hypothetical protein